MIRTRTSGGVLDKGCMWNVYERVNRLGCAAGVDHCGVVFARWKVFSFAVIESVWNVFIS